MKNMIKSQRSITGLIFITLLIIVASCKKDDDSAYGNAKIYSAQYTVTWTAEAPGYYCTIDDEYITQDIVDNGSVEVYMSNGSDGWISLPMTLPISSTYSSTFTPVHYLGGVTVWALDTDTEQSADPGSTTFKVVCISAAVKLANSNLDWNNYAAVKKAFNL
jgi:hypothetical protein